MARRNGLSKQKTGKVENQKYKYIFPQLLFSLVKFVVQERDVFLVSLVYHRFVSFYWKDWVNCQATTGQNKIIFETLLYFIITF